VKALAARASSVVVHRVTPAAKDAFLALQKEITNAAAAFDGYAALILIMLQA
jgi:antibiotic biosynthesis monooxygenase (ABM) superfamily enzyme